MSLPLTARFSEPFLSSRVSISACVSYDGHGKESLRTLSAELEVDDIGHLDIDDTEEPLVILLVSSVVKCGQKADLPLELALVKDLHRNDRRILDGSTNQRCPMIRDECQRTCQNSCLVSFDPSVRTGQGRTRSSTG